MTPLAGCENGRVLDPALRDDIESLTTKLEPELIDFRRDLHRHPELARKEHRTTRAIVDRLIAADLSPRVLASGTGVICDVVGSDGSPPRIGFRGDIDALPLTDVKPVPYRSTVDGVCHACGHDAHTAMTLGSALVLAELAKQGSFTSSARLIFQPAEEVTPGGALDVLADGGIDGLEQVFALHCDPNIAVGHVGFRSGLITAGADRIRVTMRGPGGHTARPHLTSDLAYALGKVITELPAVLSRLADPRAGLSVVWGQVHAGAAANAIPQTGYAEGTMRCLDARVWESAHNRVPDLIRSLVAPYGVDVEVDMHTSVPPCVNDAQATEFMQTVTADMLGPLRVTGTDQSLGGEDFGWILGRVPGALARLGVRSHEVADAGDLHRGSFDIDERALAVGVRLFAGLAATEATR
ncbi:MAG: amidohydrolase [Nocardioidaceae bacterium]|nr:amidohydrolase [Nocardioidaceae bacterium]